MSDWTFYTLTMVTLPLLRRILNPSEEITKTLVETLSDGAVLSF